MLLAGSLEAEELRFQTTGLNIVGAIYHRL
jgi:hypothetical protein